MRNAKIITVTSESHCCFWKHQWNTTQGDPGQIVWLWWYSDIFWERFIRTFWTAPSNFYSFKFGLLVFGVWCSILSQPPQLFATLVPLQAIVSHHQTIVSSNEAACRWLRPPERSVLVSFRVGKANLVASRSSGPSASENVTGRATTWSIR